MIKMSNTNTSQSFSVDDIRKVRNEDHKRRQNMTAKELSEDIRKCASEGHKIMEQLKQSSLLTTKS